MTTSCHSQHPLSNCCTRQSASPKTPCMPKIRPDTHQQTTTCWVWCNFRRERTPKWKRHDWRNQNRRWKERRPQSSLWKAVKSAFSSPLVVCVPALACRRPVRWCYHLMECRPCQWAILQRFGFLKISYQCRRLNNPARFSDLDYYANFEASKDMAMWTFCKIMRANADWEYIARIRIDYTKEFLRLCEALHKTPW